MGTILQHDRLIAIRENAYDVRERARWTVGKAIDAVVTNPSYRLTGWICEGRATTPEQDAESAYRMGFEMGQAAISHPTRQQVADSLRQLGLEVTDERLDRMGFAAYPAAVQRPEAMA